MNDVICAIDIGTANIRIIIAQRLETGQFQVVGVGSSPSSGLKKGTVVNIENTVQAINKALDIAEEMSGFEVSSCYVGLGGSHIEGLNSKGVYPISDKGGGNTEIGYDDINAVINSAKAIVIPLDRKVIKVIPQSFTVDKQTGIKDPHNMIGVRLEAEAHIITASVTAIQNTIKCVTRSNLTVEKAMYNGLSAVKSVMTQEEIEAGSLLIDIGAGVIDVVLMHDGAPSFITVLPIGGDTITNDLAVVEKISFEVAENIKLTNGCCWAGLLDDENLEILLPGVGGRAPIRIMKTKVCEIFQVRMQEIFYIIKQKIDPVIKTKPLGGNIVISGGGALLTGVIEVASEVFETSAVRIGVPGLLGNIKGEYRGSEFATVMGLVAEAADLGDYAEGKVKKPSGSSMLTKVKNVFKNLF
ncbi:MAG: cell division protein FtsA [Treponema sp.]